MANSESNRLSKKPEVNITLSDLEKHGKHHYKNHLGKVSKHKVHGKEIYLSTTKFKPRALTVQASNSNVNYDEEVDWERCKVRGTIPHALRISEWALGSAFPKQKGVSRVRWIGIPGFIIRTLLVAFPLQVYMSLPMFTAPWDEDIADNSYQDWPGKHWKWPKFAVNPLDMKPSSSLEDAPRTLSAIPRLLRPRLLMVRQGNDWFRMDMDLNPDVEHPYVMISYANRHFHTDTGRNGEPASEEGKRQLRHIARYHAHRLGVSAYWMDFECRAPKDEKVLLDSDVNRFCDVVRGSRAVIIALPNGKIETAQEWGNRMWTLPEGLLAPGPQLTFHHADTDTTTVRTKVEMANLTWRSTNKPRNGQDVQATRVLAEHYMGLMQLSRLQLIATALVSLWDRKAAEKDEHRPGELAHALMGLLHTRIDPDPTNTLFQDIAKLSLMNDSDRLVERMICLLPAVDTSVNDYVSDTKSNTDPFRMLQHADEFNTHLWDIHPTCNVVGVDEDDRTVILSDCRAMTIRWKAFPRITYRKSSSIKKFLAEMLLRSGTWWITIGISLGYTYAPLWAYAQQIVNGDEVPTNKAALTYLMLWVVLFFMVVGMWLSVLGPLSLRILYGGVALQPAPHLVAFEGTMPIGELEYKIFGNFDNRLKYEPSATEFSKHFRDQKERTSKEPDWVRDGTKPPKKLKAGHRIFTLVDTGNLSVSLFQAERPPTVALICGREGGMLRTVLCSWKSDADCLYKETVLRMPTETYSLAVPKGWLKLQLSREELSRPRPRKSKMWFSRTASANNTPKIS